MFRIRGKAANGNSITGDVDAESFADVVSAVEEQAETAGTELRQITVKVLDKESSIRIAPPRKRGEAAAPAPSKSGKKK